MTTQTFHESPRARAARATVTSMPSRMRRRIPAPPAPLPQLVASQSPPARLRRRIEEEAARRLLAPVIRMMAKSLGLDAW